MHVHHRPLHRHDSSGAHSNRWARREQAVVVGDRWVGNGIGIGIGRLILTGTP